MILRIGLLYLTSSWDLRASFQALKQYLIMVFYCKKLIWIPFSNYFLFYLIIHSCKTSKTVKFTGENAFFNWCKAERSQTISLFNWLTGLKPFNSNCENTFLSPLVSPIGSISKRAYKSRQKVDIRVFWFFFFQKWNFLTAFCLRGHFYIT